jgi:predicted RNA-binding Zn ribbon-like protein
MRGTAVRGASTKLPVPNEGGSVRRPAAPGRLAVVQAFLNSVDLEEGVDQIDSAPALVGWLHTKGLLDDTQFASEIEFHQAIELREALRTLVSIHNPAGGQDERVLTTAAAVLTEAATRSRPQLRFHAADVAEIDAAVPGVPGALGRLLAIVYGAQVDGSWSRLKVCREDICRWAFYDYSRNHAGTWCTMAVCGTRAKMRSYYQRRSGSRREHRA